MRSLRFDGEEGRVRLNFQLRASENPLLVGQLLELPKGKLRHARLATLATIGLLAEARMTRGDIYATCRHGEALASEVNGRRPLPDLSEAFLKDIEDPERG